MLSKLAGITLVALVLTTGCSATEQSRSAAPAIAGVPVAGATRAAAPVEPPTGVVVGSSGPTPRRELGLRVDDVVGILGHLSVDNQLKNPFATNWFPAITWSVVGAQKAIGPSTLTSSGDPSYQGIQLVTEAPFSGVVTTELEVPDAGSGAMADHQVDFTLEPSIRVADVTYPLVPMLFTGSTEGPLMWSIRIGDEGCAPKQKATVTRSVKTSQGILTYDLLLDCTSEAAGGPKVTIRTSP